MKKALIALMASAFLMSGVAMAATTAKPTHKPATMVHTYHAKPTAKPKAKPTAKPKAKPTAKPKPHHTTKPRTR